MSGRRGSREMSHGCGDWPESCSAPAERDGGQAKGKAQHGKIQRKPF